MSDHAHHIIPPRIYFLVFAALMGLLVATVAGAYIKLPESLHWLHLTIALGIAAAKAVLIVMFFMHVRYSNRLTWVFASAAFVWLAILLVFSLSDYASRGWLDIEGK
jgi:cytochrome c oxidase subunit 4